MKRLMLLSVVLVVMTLSQAGVHQTAFAIPYNYVFDGVDFDITGMFDCTQASLSNCNETNISNWMFTANNTPTFGTVTVTSSDAGANLLGFSGVNGRLDAGNNVFGIGAENGNPPTSLYVEPAVGMLESTSVMSPVVITAKTPPTIPEPSTMILFGSGLAGLIGWRLRKLKPA